MTEPNYTIVRNSYPPKHVCQCPGWRSRRRAGLKPGAQVCCNDCGQLWEWKDSAGQTPRCYGSELTPMDGGSYDPAQAHWPHCQNQPSDPPP